MQENVDLSSCVVYVFSDLAEEIARRHGAPVESWPAGDARDRGGREMANIDRSVTSAVVTLVQWF